MAEENNEDIDAYSGMISREAASNLSKPRKIKVEDILSGNVREGELVDIEDYVYRVFNPRRFEKDGRERHVRTIILGNVERSVRVTLWDKSSALVDMIPIERQDKIYINNLLVRKGLNELELSSRGNTFFTRISASNTGISDFSTLTAGENNIDILAKIVAIGPVKYFDYQNGKQRKVARCTLSDGLVNLSAAFWDSSCEYISTAHPGDYIKIEFGSVKENNGLEINAGNFSRVVANKLFKNRMKWLKD